MRTIISLLLSGFFFYSQVGLGQSKLKRDIYDHVKKIGFENNDLNLLVARLTNRFGNDDLKKAESIYLWIKLNISYDFQKFYERNQGAGLNDTINIDQVLTERKGVCEDFSLLAQKMFEKTSIKCTTITGWAKPASAQMFNDTADFGHAWNAIFLNGKWILVDCTWASLGRTYQTDTSDFYFDPPPEAFIYTHYPKDIKWCLVNPVPSYGEYKKFPFVSPLMFSNIRSQLPSTGYFNTKNGYIDIPKFMEIDSSIEVQLENIDNDEVTSPGVKVVQENGTISRYRIPIAEKGKYILRIGTKTYLNFHTFNFNELIAFAIMRN